jgi:lycopene cyclase domain-containing protein
VFDHYSYLGYTLLFCVPAILVLWTLPGPARALRADLKGILLATATLTLYGSLIWPLAIHWRCWSYDDGKVLNVKLFGLVYLEDVVWWLLVSFLMASFAALGTRFEEERRDPVAGLCRTILSTRARPGDGLKA